MELAEVTDESKIELLELTKNYIASCRETYICIALMDIAELLESPRPDLVNVAAYLKQYICDQLGKLPDGTSVGTLDSWLHHRDGVWYDEDGFMRQARVQWIDWMIQQLREK